MESRVSAYHVVERPTASDERASAPAAFESNGHGHPTLAAVSTGWRQRLVRWGIGSSLLSVLGLICLGLFEQYNGMLSELRSDLKRFNETSAEFAKRDQLQRLREQMWQLTKELQAANVARAPMELELRACERNREDLTKEMQRLRERLAYLEGQQAARAYMP